MRCTSPSNKRTRQLGFTLVEMLVIAPIIILAIGTFVVTMIVLTGDVLSVKGSSDLTYNTQSALNTMDRDIIRANEILATSYTPTSPQGTDGAGGLSGGNAFTTTGASPSAILILRMLGLSDNPIVSTRGVIYKDCSGPLYTVDVAYYLSGGSLWRRVLKNPSSNPCVTSWDQPSCSPGTTGTICYNEDTEVMQNVNSMNITYYNATNQVIAGPSPSATAVRITLQVGKVVGGRDLSYTGTLYTRRGNAPFAY
jgi:hypothetical protein